MRSNARAVFKRCQPVIDVGEVSVFKRNACNGDSGKAAVSIKAVTRRALPLVDAD